MTKKEIKNAIEYWKKTAEHDYKTMQALLDSKDYSNCLFFGHIVLEKLLKGLYVEKMGKQTPFTHDLVYLNDAIKLDLSVDERKFLYEVNSFNIRARYPDAKLKFYKECTRAYTEKRLKGIKAIYKKLWGKLK